MFIGDGWVDRYIREIFAVCWKRDGVVWRGVVGRVAGEDDCGREDNLDSCLSRLDARGTGQGRQVENGGGRGSEVEIGESRGSGRGSEVDNGDADIGEAKARAIIIDRRGCRYGSGGCCKGR